MSRRSSQTTIPVLPALPGVLVGTREAAEASEAARATSSTGSPCFAGALCGTRRERLGWLGVWDAEGHAEELESSETASNDTSDELPPQSRLLGILDWSLCSGVNMCRLRVKNKLFDIRTPTAIFVLLKDAEHRPVSAPQAPVSFPPRASRIPKKSSTTGGPCTKAARTRRRNIGSICAAGFCFGKLFLDSLGFA